MKNKENKENTFDFCIFFILENTKNTKTLREEQFLEYNKMIFCKFSKTGTKHTLKFGFGQ